MKRHTIERNKERENPILRRANRISRVRAMCSWDDDPTGRRRFPVAIPRDEFYEGARLSPAAPT